MQIHCNLATSFENVSNLIEKQIPEQSKNLSDNVVNLEKVAQYCEDIYVNSKDSDKQHLLNETKGYTTQALASVAYQIHVLANSFLQLLENQSDIVNDMKVSMSHLSHEVSIHKEKVARREIGVLTTNKCIVRTLKVKRPEVDEKPVKYVRKPIDYSSLDDIGHGVKLTRQTSLTLSTDPVVKNGVGRQNSYSSTHSSSSVTNGTSNNAPSAQSKISDTPPPSIKANLGNGMNTIRSNNANNSYYRQPVAAPVVPSEYLSRQELGIYSSKKELNQSGGADTLSSAYGTQFGYKRPSVVNNTNSVNEYSGADTLDRRMTNAYMQQFSNNSNNPIMMMMNNSGAVNPNNSIGYASGNEIGLIRTNLNNIDYATNGTMYRRPQLHPSIINPSIYERSCNNDNTNQLAPRMSGPPPPPPQQQNRLTNNNISQGILPPPPPILFENQNDHLENEVFGGSGEYLEREEDLDLIPNWVPIDRCLEKVITTFDYERLRDDELSFKENTFIYVIKKNDDHWYEGIMKNENGQIIQGLYPYNYARCVRKYMDDSRITQC